MVIVLSPETQRLLEEKLKSGEYRSPDQLVHAALEALSELEAHGLDEETLQAIDRAEDQIERGDVRHWRDVREQVRGRFLGK
jgi:Arc/MetJ-type ribon-helix-helix transcriptional regulator